MNKALDNVVKLPLISKSIVSDYTLSKYLYEIDRLFVGSKKSTIRDLILFQKIYIDCSRKLTLGDGRSGWKYYSLSNKGSYLMEIAPFNHHIFVTGDVLTNHSVGILSSLYAFKALSREENNAFYEQKHQQLDAYARQVKDHEKIEVLRNIINV